VGYADRTEAGYSAHVSRNLKTALLLAFVALTTFCAIIAKYYFIKIGS
jgi:hypothetical protein